MITQSTTPRFRADIWQQFCDSGTTLATRQREYPEWHQGRERFLVWGLLFDDAELTSLMSALRQSLNRFLVLPYPRQPHVTLAAAGFHVTTPNRDDDYSPLDLQRHVALIRQLALKPFRVEVGGLNSFTSALYLEVHDCDGQLERVRSQLDTYFEVIRTHEFVPHVTVGVYADNYPVEAVVAAVARLPQPRRYLHCESIVLMSYDACDIGSPLCVERRIPLRVPS